MTTRRSFLTLLGGAAAAWPVGAWAQHASIPVVGFLSNVSPDVVAQAVTAFRQGLAEHGYAEGQNLTVEHRWAEGHNDRLPQLAPELIDQRVAAIVATGGGASALVVKSATTTIPIIFTSASDPV